MQTFDFSFTVQASLSSVAEFHHDTSALRRLTPPPIFVQLHRIEPIAEGSLSEFTLWFGLLPIYWIAQHSGVDPQRGFTDTQIHGPMKRWVHTHFFSEEVPNATRIIEHIEYEHYEGARGILSRLLFTPIGLRLMFCYRRFVTRRLLERAGEDVVREGKIPV